MTRSLPALLTAWALLWGARAGLSQCDHWKAEHKDATSYVSLGAHSGIHSDHNVTAIGPSPLHDVSVSADVWSGDAEGAASAHGRAMQSHLFEVKWEPGNCQQEHANRPSFRCTRTMSYAWSRTADVHEEGSTWGNGLHIKWWLAHPWGEGWWSDDPADWPTTPHTEAPGGVLSQGDKYDWEFTTDWLNEEWSSNCMVEASVKVYKTGKGESRASAQCHEEWSRSDD
jgi:hypothetical protein